MKAHDLVAPQRPVQQDAHPQDGTIVTDRVDEVWGTDMTQTVTTGEGRAFVFIAVDHCSGEFIGTHASSSASRWEAPEPVRQGVTRHFGGVGLDVAQEGSVPTVGVRGRARSPRRSAARGLL